MTAVPQQFFGISDPASLFVANDVEPAMAHQLVKSHNKRVEKSICPLHLPPANKIENIVLSMTFSAMSGFQPKAMPAQKPCGLSGIFQSA
ncbi:MULTISPECIES: hypothetical protein [Alphaproteobacteria]|uniref:hypothetical protein n=1 Tax=Alphaproteobacteria TaxID=28211 RepID=UPI00329916F1